MGIRGREIVANMTTPSIDPLKLNMFDRFDRFDKLNQYFIDNRDGIKWQAEAEKRAQAGDVKGNTEHARSPRYSLNPHAMAAIFFATRLRFGFWTGGGGERSSRSAAVMAAPAWLLTDIAERVIVIDIDDSKLVVARAMFPEVGFLSGNFNQLLENKDLSGNIDAILYPMVDAYDVAKVHWYDRAVLAIHHDPRIKPKMTRDEAMPIVRQIIAERWEEFRDK